MPKKQPFFSIVIPTRNRHETLPFTIKTVLEQSFIDYELLICDNNSTIETKKIVNSFKSDKIKYIRSDIDLSMTDNWELALSNVKGKYITIIADNDGFIDGSLMFLYQLILKHQCPSIVRWEKNEYNWPDMDNEIRNKLSLRTNTTLEILNGNQTISNVITGKTKFQMLPMIYNSVISSSLLDSLKMKTGRIFNSVSPDIYSGYAFAFLSKQYLSLNMPITIGGNSLKSTGYNCLKKSNNNKIEKEFKSLSEKSQFTFHPKIPFIKSIHAALSESFLRAQEELGIIKITLDRKKTMTRILDTLLVHDNEELSSTKEKILIACSDDEKLLEYVKNLLLKNEIKILEPKKEKRKFGFSNDMLYLDGEKFNLKSIYDVSKFMSNFYNYSSLE